jgi:hypothetical protein
MGTVDCQNRSLSGPFPSGIISKEEREGTSKGRASGREKEGEGDRKLGGGIDRRR